MSRHPGNEPEKMEPEEVIEMMTAVADIVRHRGKGRYGFIIPKEEIKNGKDSAALEIDVTIIDQQRHEHIGQVHVIAMKNKPDRENYSHIYLSQVSLEKGTKERVFLQSQHDTDLGDLGKLEHFEMDIKALVSLIAG